MSWITRVLGAIADALSRAPDPDAALPPDARREREMWDAEDVARYMAEQKAGKREASADAPHIDEGGI